MEYFRVVGWVAGWAGPLMSLYLNYLYISMNEWNACYEYVQCVVITNGPARAAAVNYLSDDNLASFIAKTMAKHGESDLLNIYIYNILIHTISNSICDTHSFSATYSIWILSEKKAKSQQKSVMPAVLSWYETCAVRLFVWPIAILCFCRFQLSVCKNFICFTSFPDSVYRSNSVVTNKQL